jgi:hypothetical protein
MNNRTDRENQTRKTALFVAVAFLVVAVGAIALTGALGSGPASKQTVTPKEQPSDLIPKVHGPAKTAPETPRAPRKDRSSKKKEQQLKDKRQRAEDVLDTP